jgi:hypothetical protein
LQLLRLFGGGAGPTEQLPKSPTPTIPAAPAARTVETTGLTKLTSKKDRTTSDLFSPPTTKKKTKPAAAKAKRGYQLSMDVMKTLGELGVVLPTSEDATKETVEELKAKLGYYRENQGRVTQEVPNTFLLF